MSSSTYLGGRGGRAALAALVGLTLLAGAACRGEKKADVATTSAPARTFDAAVAPTATDSAAGPAASPAAPAFPPPREDAELVRLMIPAAKVNAPLQIKGVNARNEMENPDGKDNVAWYNFSTRPGFGSNAVFSGHVDWFTGEQGVFWGLRNVKAGDEIMLKLSDGSELKYRIESNETYTAEDAPVADIVGPTVKEVVTLITCDGVFDRRSQEYDKRRVVRAERIG
ncbi:MAG: class F sortase [Dehalococcoidia bacterium]